MTEAQEAGDADYSDLELEEPDNEETIDQEEMMAAKDGVDSKVSNISPILQANINALSLL